MILETTDGTIVEIRNIRGKNCLIRDECAFLQRKSSRHSTICIFAKDL